MLVAGKNFIIARKLICALTRDARFETQACWEIECTKPGKNGNIVDLLKVHMRVSTKSLVTVILKDLFSDKLKHGFKEKLSD